MTIVPIVGVHTIPPVPTPPAPRSYVEFDLVTGAVYGAGKCDGTTYYECYQPREDVLEVPLNTQRLDTYVDVEAKTYHPKLPSQVILDGATLRNVPVPSTIVVDGQSFANEDTVVVLEFDMPGTYKVTVKSVRELDGVFMVTWP